MRRLLFFLLFLASLLGGFYLNQRGRYREIYRSICDLTEEHFYREDERLEDWLRRCYWRADHVQSSATVEQLMGNIQDVMNEMQISHFQVYTPVEDRRLWKGQSIDTGIHSRFVEDHLVVYKVLPDSSADKAGVRAGDDILKIEGAEQLTPWGAQHRSGKFSLRRGERELVVDLQARDFTTDNSPQVTELNRATALLELSSFRSEFYERKAWLDVVAKFSRYPNVILDLRENAGGNFVAMLRALSSFQCGGKSVGQLIQPRKDLPDKPAFDDNTADAYQIRQLDEYRSMGLRTFGTYGCYTGRVTVLIGPETSSVSEIFAHSFLARKNSRVWGQPTAGDVVLAVWYDLPALGPGFSVSIPEAVYLTPDSQELEGKGIWPQRELYFDLKEALEGKDSWIERAK